MTGKQLYLYWSLWRAACSTQGWDQTDAGRRHAVTLEVLGYERSSRELNNREFDRVLARLKVLAAPDDLEARIAETDPTREERKRTMWATQRLARFNLCARRGLAAASDADVEAHLAHIATDLHDSCRWRELPLPALCRLRDLVADRLESTIRAIKTGKLPEERIRIFAPCTLQTPTREILRRVTQRHLHLEPAPC